MPRLAGLRPAGRRPPTPANKWASPLANGGPNRWAVNLWVARPQVASTRPSDPRLTVPWPTDPPAKQPLAGHPLGDRPQLPKPLAGGPRPAHAQTVDSRTSNLWLVNPRQAYPCPTEPWLSDTLSDCPRPTDPRYGGLMGQERLCAVGRSRGWSR